MKEFLKISPIGGLKEIGANCTHIQTAKRSILIDCGILFPNDSVFELNYLIPDLSVLGEVDTIIITHGHEDHIGAIYHYVMKFPNADIYAPPFAKNLIINKLSYKKIQKEIKDLSEHNFDGLEIKSFHVNHSIPHTRGLIIAHKEIDTALTFISDFKIDLNGTYEKPFDFEALKYTHQFSRRIAMLDSTNILSKNTQTPGEGALIDDLHSLIENCNGIAYVTSFSSNIYRIQTILNIANKLGRVVIPLGRSMERYIQSAQELELLENIHVLRESTDGSVKKKKIVLLSGCQGDFKGALKRVASNQDSKFKMKPEDVVIFSSKPIPGNEKEISSIYNAITELGAKVHTPDNFLIHASGHPGRDDLQYIYNLLKPTHAFPIHGESYFLQTHCDFIKKHNLSENTYMILNGDHIFITATNLKISHHTNPPQPVLIHGNDLIIEREKVSERRKLASLGLVAISFSVESITKFKPSCEVTTMGLPNSIDRLIPTFKELLGEELKSTKNRTIEERKEQLRIFTRRFFEKDLGYRPLAIIHFC